MGIVKRQGIKASLLVYIGFALGAVNLLVLFPHFFSEEQVGLTRVLNSTIVTFTNLCLLGLPAVIVKFYPYYKDHAKEKNDLMFWSTLIAFVGFITISTVTWYFYPTIVAYFSVKSPLLSDYFYLTFIGGFLLVVYTIFETYSRSNLRNIVPVFLREVGLRIYTGILVLLYALGFIDFNGFIWLLTIYFGIACIVMIIDLGRLSLLKYHITTTKITHRLKGKMFAYGSFIYGGGMFGIIADNVDTFLIAGISGLKSTGVFTVASYISTILQVPQRTISGIATPILAQNWKDKNYANIRYLYEKTSLNQLIFGITIFLGVWLNIDDLFSFLPPAYAEGKYVVLVMCFARILDLGTGINAELLTTSNMWRFSFYTQVIFIGLSIPTNYFLISKFGIVGSAFSNLFAYTAFNSIRFVFIYRKFKMQPFSMNTLYVFLIGFCTYLLIAYIPLTNTRILDITIRCVLVVLCIGIPVLKFKLSEDIYILWNQILIKIKLK
jgi:O-antigen/teichoic acid export membrane protein